MTDQKTTNDEPAENQTAENPTADGQTTDGQTTETSAQDQAGSDKAATDGAMDDILNDVLAAAGAERVTNDCHFTYYASQTLRDHSRIFSLSAFFPCI